MINMLGLVTNSSMNENEIQSPYQKEMEIVHLMIFLEKKPMSGELAQVMLTHEHYVKVLNFIEQGLIHNSTGQFVIPVNEKVTVKVEYLKPSYTPEEIKKATGLGFDK